MRLRSLIAASGILGLAIGTLATPPALGNGANLRLNAVVIGDSYSAGNGAGAYEPGTEKTSYRSTRNWARVYTSWLNEQGIHTTLTNLAASGSVTANVLNEQIPQISKETDLVMLTIGGNDLEFSTIVSDCFAAGIRSRGACVEALDNAEAGLDAAIANTRTIFDKVNEKIGDDGHMILLAYPLLATTRQYELASCEEWGLVFATPTCVRWESTEIGSRVRELGNLATHKQKELVDSWNASHAMKVSYIDSVPSAFAGHEPDPSALHRNPARWINEFFETEGIESDGSTTSSWTIDRNHFYHPNITGHQMMAREIQENIGVSFSAEPINPGSGDIDVVFVVDATGSMTDDIDAVRSNVSGILTKLASVTDSYRVALVTYKDFSDSGGDPGDYPSQVNLDFTTDANALRSALGNLEVTGGGDWPETVYSGVTSALNLSWRSGVRKIAIVLGDAPAKEPEPHTGHDAHSVAVHALEVDPVEVYAIDTGSLTSPFSNVQSLVDETGGSTFLLDPNSDIPTLITEAMTTALSKPFGWLQGPIIGEVGETLEFDARGSYAIGSVLTSYEWDFDSDGVIDETTTSGLVEHAFAAPFTGTASVTVTDALGAMSRGSAPISVTIPPEPEPEPEIPEDKPGVLELLDGAPLPTPGDGSQSGVPSDPQSGVPSDPQSGEPAPTPNETVTTPPEDPTPTKTSTIARTGATSDSVGALALAFGALGALAIGFVRVSRRR